MIRIIKRKIYELFRKLFPSKQDEENVSFSNPSNELSKQDNVKEYDSYIEDLFDQICPGDIVYAHMPLPEKVLEKISDGHRTRPYYIAYKLDDGFIAYSSSSSPYENIPDTKIYILSEIIYKDLTKTSYLNLNKSYYLPKDKLIKFICKTKKNDYNEIQRRLWIGRTQEYENLYKEKPILCNPIPGDIVEYNKSKWLIIDEDDHSYSAFKISINNKKNISNAFFIHCNDDVWRINLSIETIIDKTDLIKTKHIVNKDEFIVFKRQLELAKKNNKKKKSKSNKPPKYFTKFNIGTVFNDYEENEEYVYLYSNKSYDYCIKISEYLNNDLYPEYSLYETLVQELTKDGEVADDELKQILSDQISYGNDKCQILKNKIKDLDSK